MRSRDAQLRALMLRLEDWVHVRLINAPSRATHAAYCALIDEHDRIVDEQRAGAAQLPGFELPAAGRPAGRT